MTRYEAITNLVREQGSRIFSVTFIKRDGTVRTMLVQYAATRTHCVGDAASEAAKKAAKTRAANHPNLLNVFDIQKRAIRSINMDTVTRIANFEVTA